ncbi:Ham1-like protein [Candidatus Koribacter versatilis Ellin345]|uniref:dITP/XTP pyrophosphatase n=1 Tax=Koribacter versatilis (strain Ellin345) TaxID=204669 RepID=Q1IN12_KORVE|nr:RdgB/HAM1 family non-canonical purine NTP pyrophosphatase [Candidatus Koribacter versatilis]ABF41738.1 Ham1-like protein [Candidatus Koribacter versatilis Ellin345]
MRRILVATSNPGKIRDFIGAARVHGVELDVLPEYKQIEPPEETGETFEANARLKAEYYSHHVPAQLVLADDSGLEVDALNRAPGVRSARYATDEIGYAGPDIDDRNNALVLERMKDVHGPQRTGRFVCVLALARDGLTIATFHGKAEGRILRELRGSNGFGYDPMFFFPEIGKTFAELSAEEKSHYSHRGAAFRKLLDWADQNQNQNQNL